VKLKRIKSINKRTKIKRTKKKKTIHYKFRLKGKTKNNETFIKDSRKKNKNNKNKHQILNIKT
jgi:hypothetical protein